KQGCARMTDDADDEAFNEILRGLDHDLRNPVANILGFVDLLRESPNAVFNPEQLTFLERIEDNCRELLTMLERLTQVAKRH
ncbi:MAG: histidine kinase dimerization/phospho-acceptor domain-containing protein, partial [Candidatus Binatia bacterium]